MTNQTEKIKSYLNKPYARIVIPVEPSGFHAEVLEFPGCFAQGETLEQAYSNLETAAESWIEACLAQDHEVPEPSSSLTYSGRIVLRLPRSIHQKAAQLAERDATSLNSYLVAAVSAKVGAEDVCEVLARKMEVRISQAAYFAIANYSSVITTGAERMIRPLSIQKKAVTRGVNTKLLSMET